MTLTLFIILVNSVMSGIAGLDCAHPSIQKVLRCMANEMLSADFEFRQCDVQTARLLQHTYQQLLIKNQDLVTDAEISSFMVVVAKTLSSKTLTTAQFVAASAR